MTRVSENVIHRPGGGVLIRRTVEIEVPAGTSLLMAETLMQEALQKTGAGMVEEFLHAHDPPLDSLDRKGRKWTRKLQSEPRVVESTFGAVTISRWAYQTSRGGSCLYPLDDWALRRRRGWINPFPISATICPGWITRSGCGRIIPSPTESPKQPAA